MEPWDQQKLSRLSRCPDFPGHFTQKVTFETSTKCLDYTVPIFSSVHINRFHCSKDRYEIRELLEILHSKKQPRSSVCLKKAQEMHKKCLNNAVPLLNKTENQIF